MQSSAKSVKQYIDELPLERQSIINQLRETIKNNIPPGFEESMQYGMISFVVPHTCYPAGYHCNPKDALPFISLASQKQHIAIYHMGIYSNANLEKWFREEYTKLNIGQLDMGKSCIRFKNISKIPTELIGQLASKMTLQDWVSIYESNLKK